MQGLGRGCDLSSRPAQPHVPGRGPLPAFIPAPSWFCLVPGFWL